VGPRKEEGKREETEGKKRREGKFELLNSQGNAATYLRYVG